MTDIKTRISGSFEQKTPVQLPSLTQPGEDAYTLYMRPLSAKEMIKAQKLGADDTALRLAHIVMYSACDKDGKQVFNANDVDTLADMRYGDLNALADAAIYPAGNSDTPPKTPQ